MEKRFNKNIKNFLAGFISRKKTKNNHSDFPNDVYALQRSEIIDECTCEICLSMDGLILTPDDELVSFDLFHEGCRGIWVEILKEEIDPPPITGVPNGLRKLFSMKKGTNVL